MEIMLEITVLTIAYLCTSIAPDIYSLAESANLYLNINTNITYLISFSFQYLLLHKIHLFCLQYIFSCSIYLKSHLL